MSRPSAWTSCPPSSTSRRPPTSCQRRSRCDRQVPSPLLPHLIAPLAPRSRGRVMRYPTFAGRGSDAPSGGPSQSRQRIRSQPISASRRHLMAEIQTQGVHHITFVGSNREEIIAFYSGVLGMPLVLDQPNLDVPEEEHLYFDPGDGRLITFFVRPSRTLDPAPNPQGIGNL